MWYILRAFYYKRFFKMIYFILGYFGMFADEDIFHRWHLYMSYHGAGYQIVFHCWVLSF
jgi:hypothetical protein